MRYTPLWFWEWGMGNGEVGEMRETREEMTNDK